jgi:hypothetical protein
MDLQNADDRRGAPDATVVPVVPVAPVATVVAASGSGAAGVPWVRRLGRTTYLDTWRAMQAFTDARDAATCDELWLTEHPPVYTLGLAGRTDHLHPAAADGPIEVVRTDRGGQVTYHGPGQVVMYVLLDLKRSRPRPIIGLNFARHGREPAPVCTVEVKARSLQLALLGANARVYRNGSFQKPRKTDRACRPDAGQAPRSSTSSRPLGQSGLNAARSGHGTG